MVLHDGHLNFFNVNFCGLYKVRDENAKGCELTETFDLIKTWVESRSGYLSTTPWDPESRPNKSKCYCREIYKSSEGDFFIVLWKSETDGAGSIYGIPENEKPGEGDIIEQGSKVGGKNIIWGKPCYYWAVPSLNLVISIKFEFSTCDTQLFQDYVKAAITNRVKHPKKTKSLTRCGQTRLAFEENPSSLYSYRFDVNLLAPETSSAEIQELAKKVKGIVRREHIIVDATDERAQWLKKFDNLPFIEARPKTRKRKVEIYAEGKPTPEQIRKIIEDYAQESRNSSEWDRVGFKTEDDTTTWVDKYRLKHRIAILGIPASQIGAETIYQKIASERDKILAPIRKLRSEEQKSKAS
jgi:hypothetical protein